MTTATAERITTERESLIRVIGELSDNAISQLKGYADRVREEELEALEDAEDIAYIEAHKDDPVVPFDVKEYETA
jgi:hypothetical protein